MGFIYVFSFEYQLLILWGYVGTTLGVYRAVSVVTCVILVFTPIDNQKTIC